jgi:hypothetical protein
MTQTGLTGRKISQNLDKKLIQKGGMTIIDLPTIECSLASEHETQKVQMFGYRSIIVYNKHREKQHRVDKFNQKVRALNRNIKTKGLRQCGLTVNTGVKGGHKS